jgi:hypothetical protein
MPLLYVISHVLFSLLCFYLAWRARKWPALFNTLGLGALVVVIAGLAVERRSEWAWKLMPYAGTDLVFWTNVTLEGAAVLCAVLWCCVSSRRERRRAGLLFAPLLGVALWSYAWYFEPLPPGVKGRADASGLCLQSTVDSCSAAAAVMLLHRHGIAATEAEMAALCLTRAGKGTCAPGLYRGLALKAATQQLRPQVVSPSQPEALRSLHQPAIITVGLKSNTPPNIAAKMEGYGWNIGSRHTVVVLGTDAAGRWIEIADPSNGKERWPTEELAHLWDGNALILVKVK